MTCIFCKRELPDDAVFCLYCGKKQRSEEKKHIRHRGNGQGSVYKDSKGHYTAEKTFGYYMESGKRKRIFKRKKGFTTKKAALEYLATLTQKTKDRKAPTLSELWATFEQYVSCDLSKSKQTAYRIAWKNIKSSVGYRSIDDFTVSELQDVTDRAAKSYYTRRDVKTLFSHFYKLAIRDDYVTDNKAQYIKLPKLIEKEKEIFTKDEIQTLWLDYNAHKCKVTAAILIMIYTGMRPGELLQIKTENVNLNEQYLTGGIKTEKGKRRKIIIPDRIVPLIQYLERASKDGLLCWYKNKNDFYDEWQEKRDELEIRECMTPYCCRHTYITQLTALGVSPAMLQELAGHEDYETTLNYTHLSVKDRLQEVNRL